MYPSGIGISSYSGGELFSVDSPGDGGGVWKTSSSSGLLMWSMRGRGEGASVMCSSKLHGGLGGSGMNSLTKGDEIVEVGVVVIVRLRIIGFWREGMVFLRIFVILITEGCSSWKFLISWSVLMWVDGSQLSWASEKPFHLIRYCN